MAHARVPDGRLAQAQVLQALAGGQVNEAVVGDRRPAQRQALERLEAGESAGFYQAFVAESPTWIALLPLGHTDGYPSTARGTCEVLINDRLYPVIGGPNSAHTILNIGPEKTVEVGDVATLIGPDHPAILPHEVCKRTGMGFLALITKLNARLRRLVV